MSRIGIQPIQIPAGVTVTLSGNKVQVKGSKGELSLDAHPLTTVEMKDSVIIVKRLNDEKSARAMHGLTRTLVMNMVEGVSKGFEKKLTIIGVGYRAQVAGNNLKLALGFSHPVEVAIPAWIKVSFDEKEKNEMTIAGIDKQLVGQFAADIRELRKPEPYKGKGIRYKTEYVKRKAGKAAKAE